MELKVKEVVESGNSIDVKFEQVGVADVQVTKQQIEEQGADAVVNQYKNESWFKESGLEGKIRSAGKPEVNEENLEASGLESPDLGMRSEREAAFGTEGSEEEAHDAGEGQQVGRSVKHTEV